MPNATATDIIIAASCVHTPGCYWECPKVRNVPAMPAEDVDEIVVTIVRKNGEPIVHRYGPLEIDAVFFTLASVERFVVPHEMVMKGYAAAKELRDDVAAYVEDAGSTE